MIRKFVGSLIISSLVLLIGFSTGQTSEPVTVVVMAPLSGPYAAEGESYVNNVLMATEEMNQLGGINGRQIEVIWRDTETHPDVARERLKAVLADTKVDFIVGGLSGAVEVAMGELAEREGIPTLIATEYYHTVFPIPYKYIFFGSTTIRHLFLSPTDYVFKTVMKGREGQKWYLISADYAYGEMGEKHETEYLEARGSQVVGKQRHPLGTSDYSAYIPKILLSGADVLVLNNYGTDTVNCLKQLATYGVKEKMTILVPCSNAVVPRMLGPEVIKDVYFGANFYYGLDYETTKSYVARYKARFDGKLPTVFGASLYKIKEFFKVANEVGLENKDEIVRALEEREFVFTKEFVRFRACDHATRQIIHVFRGKGPEEQTDSLDVWEKVGGSWGPAETHVVTIRE